MGERRCSSCNAPLPSSGLCRYVGRQLEYLCDAGHWQSAPHNHPLTSCQHVVPSRCTAQLRRVGAGSKTAVIAAEAGTQPTGRADQGTPASARIVGGQ